MLYYFKDRVMLMMGAENLREVKAFQQEHPEDVQQHILTYLFFAYGRSKHNPYASAPPTERRRAVILEYKLFPEIEKKPDDYWQVVEELPAVKGLLDRYLELTYTHLERQRLVILEKIEKYTAKLAKKDAKFEEEKEADDALTLFNKRLDELEILILKEDEQGVNKPAAMHLFELPEEAKKLYAKIGYQT